MKLAEKIISYNKSSLSEKEQEISDVGGFKYKKVEWPYFERRSLSSKDGRVTMFRMVHSKDGKEAVKHMLSAFSDAKAKKFVKKHADQGFLPDPEWVKKIGQRPAGAKSDESLEENKNNESKEIIDLAKKLGKEKDKETILSYVDSLLVHLSFILRDQADEKKMTLLRKCRSELDLPNEA